MLLSLGLEDLFAGGLKTQAEILKDCLIESWDLGRNSKVFDLVFSGVDFKISKVYSLVFEALVLESLELADAFVLSTEAILKYLAQSNQALESKYHYRKSTRSLTHPSRLQ